MVGLPGSTLLGSRLTALSEECEIGLPDMGQAPARPGPR
jgi:hypothetical protein